ncbi:MAG: response regulator [Sulfitobacter sp.]|nr:response regulator [Sulfitobacter sp.]
MRILIVDDDDVILEILEAFLESIDLQDVVLANSGAAALQAITETERPFECLLLDINMPQMTGIELIPHIRQVPGYGFAPIIMLTALDDRKHIAEAFVAGAWDYIVKPFEMYEIETRLHAAELRNAEMARLMRKPNEAPIELEMPVRAFRSLEGPGSPDTIGESGLVVEDALENCLQRFRVGTGGDLGMLMIQIRDFDAFRQDLSQETVDRYLVELAGNLTRVFAEQQGIVSYQGEGAFVALSFAFRAGSGPGPGSAIERAVAETDLKILGTGKTEILLGQVMSSELPNAVEPLYMLHAARSRLGRMAQT